MPSDDVGGACGVVDPEAAQRSLASLDHRLLTHRRRSRDVVGAVGLPPGTASA